VLDTSLESIQSNFKLQKSAKKNSENAGGLSSITSGIGGISKGSGGLLGGSAEGAWERLSSLGFGGRR